MKLFQSRSAIALAAVAALSMTATPAMARGWYRGHHHHHRDRIDAGDIFAGILIIGGIAAIASAASKSDRDRREEAEKRDYRRPSDEDYRDYREYRDRNGGYGDYRDDRDDRYGRPYGAAPQAGGIDGAIESCIAEVERGEHRVDDVDSVSREGEGWRVEGRLRNEGDFSCSVDVDGRIRRATVDGRAVI